MKLWVHSDASYLCKTKAQSQAEDFHYLSSRPKIPIDPNDDPPLNGPVHVLCKTIDAVIASAHEAETAGGFLDALKAASMRTTLNKMGHPQGKMPLQFDNQCATGIINQTVQQQKGPKRWT